jgi:predicted ATP-dependent protease
MTGEISLRGRVMRVGGIKEKVLAASRFGVKQVILPEGNKSDWQDVPAEVRAKLKVHFVRSMKISDFVFCRGRDGADDEHLVRRGNSRRWRSSFARQDQKRAKKLLILAL